MLGSISRSSSGSLRHGAAHRANARTQLRHRPPVVVSATIELGHVDAIADVTEVIADRRSQLRVWANNLGLEIETLSGRTTRFYSSAGDVVVSAHTIIQLRGRTPSLPCSANGWRLAPANGESLRAAGLIATPNGIQRRER